MTLLLFCCKFMRWQTMNAFSIIQEKRLLINQWREAWYKGKVYKIKEKFIGRKQRSNKGDHIGFRTKKFFFPLFLIGKHSPNRSWTHNVMLHLELVRARGASWLKENSSTLIVGVNALLVPIFCTFSILIPTFCFYHL